MECIAGSTEFISIRGKICHAGVLSKRTDGESQHKRLKRVLINAQGKSSLSFKEFRFADWMEKSHQEYPTSIGKVNIE
jgi:hypothetical protein